MPIGKMFIIFILMFSALLYTGCGKLKVEADSPEEVLSFIREKGNSASILDFYTNDTISQVNKYVKITGMKNETAADILSFIPEGAEYNVTGKKIEGSNCYISIIFTKHTSENAIGQSVDLRMVKEGKSWKIDRKDDFKKLIESYEKKGVENYLNRIK